MKRERYWPTMIASVVIGCGLFCHAYGEEKKEEAKHEEKKQEHKEEHEKKHAGADNTNLPSEAIGFQGNWVKKKKLLKEAHAKNDKIQAVVIEVNKAIDGFYDKFKEADTILDEFYVKAGFSQGEMDNLVKDVAKYLEKSKKRDIEALAKEGEPIFDDSRYDVKEKDVDAYSIEEDFKKRKQEVEQLKLDLKAIEELDKSIGARRKKLEEELKKIQKDSQEASKISDDIWNIIDDQKAKSLVTKMDGIKTTVDALKKYITVDLMKDIEGVIKKIKDQVAKVGGEVSALEKKGIIIENRASRVALLSKEKEEKLKEDVVAAAEMEQRRERKERRRKELEKAAQVSVFGVVRHSVYKAMVATNEYFGTLWTSMVNYFTGTATVKPRKKKLNKEGSEVHGNPVKKER
jgi:hypothetical protein